MNDKVKGSRPYNSERRAAKAAENRSAILQAARELISDNGYRGTSIAQIAKAAGVAVDTVYASVGRKPQLMRELLETALSGSDSTVPGPERDYVTAMRAVGSAREKLGSPEYWLMLVAERGWSPDQYRAWLVEVWCRTLLAS